MGLTHWGLNKVADILQITSPYTFFGNKFEYIHWNFIEVCSWWRKWQQFSIGPVNGLAANSHQAITWANVDHNIRHHMVSLGHSELTCQPITCDLCHYCFKQWLVPCLVPSHYLNQYSGVPQNDWDTSTSWELQYCKWHLNSSVNKQNACPWLCIYMVA